MIDKEYILKDAGLVDEDGVGQVAGSNVIVNLGSGVAEGKLVVDVSAIEVESNDELYKISLQGSSKADFADTYEDLAILELGAAEVLGGDQDSTIGRYQVLFTNQRKNSWEPAIYPYVRLYIDVDGTISTGINFSAYLTKI